MKKGLYLLLTILVLGGCKKPVEPVVVEAAPVAPVVVLEKFAFTNRMINEHNLSKEQIIDLQFYISSDIELQKTMPEQIANVENGTLVVNKQDKVHTILIPQDTPCLAVDYKNNKIVVKLSDTLELTFMNSSKRKDLFLLSAQKWENGVGTLSINGELYKAVGKSGQTYLKIAKNNVDNTNKNLTKVDGLLK